jgi:hypothetical protein
VHAKQVLAIALGGAFVVATLAAEPAPPSKRDAASMKQKIDAINELAGKSAKAPASPRRQPRRTVITENEVNAYFLFDAAKDLPTGVVNPSISIVGPGRVSGRAVVDLDAVRKASPPKSLLDPKNLLIGRLPLTAVGVLTTSNGSGRFMLESASVGNLPLPRLLLDEIVSYYSRSPERPGGLSIDDPFMLPAGIREIQVTRGQAVIIQ